TTCGSQSAARRPRPTRWWPRASRRRCSASTGRARPTWPSRRRTGSRSPSTGARPSISTSSQPTSRQSAGGPVLKRAGPSSTGHFRDRLCRPVTQKRRTRTPPKRTSLTYRFILGTIMKKFLLGGVAFGALALATPTLAQPILQAYDGPINWTGFYVGLNAGIDLGNIDAQHHGLPRGDPESYATYDLSNQPIGFAGGAQIGYNWVASNNWVLGVEADIAGSGMHGGRG